MDLFDAGFEGFPGNVTTRATFSVSSPYVNGKRKPTLTIKLTAHALTEVTPIMLTNHIYWNLNAFKVANVLEDHTMQLPLSRRFIETDDRLAANGSIGDVFGDFNGALDFTRAKPIGRDMNDTNYVCSAGCHGYDHCFIVDRAPAQQVRDIVPILNLHSAATGISMQVSSDQQAVQVYTCNWMGGNIPVKSAQIARNAGQGVEFIQKYGCVAIEPHGWVDGINNPYFGQNWDQFYGPRSSAGAAWIRPGAPYVNTQVYSFGTTA
jgi:aldose 1-epimerase